MTEPSHRSTMQGELTKAIRNRRRTILVNPAAQRRFVTSISLPALVVLLAVGTWTFWINDHAYDEVEALPSFLPLGIGLFVGILVFEATLVVQSLRVSHRVEGAAYRLVKSMERMRAGDLDFTVKLRSNDHLHEVAAELNRLMAWVRDELAVRDTRAPATADSAATATPTAELPVDSDQVGAAGRS